MKEGGEGGVHTIERWGVIATNGGSDGRFVKVADDFIAQILFSGI